jgi:hypothetical protein
MRSPRGQFMEQGLFLARGADKLESFVPVRGLRDAIALVASVVTSSSRSAALSSATSARFRMRARAVLPIDMGGFEHRHFLAVSAARAP